MDRYLQFGTQKTSDLKLIVVDGHSRKSAAREQYFTHIPGKLGDLLDVTNGFNNYDDQYVLASLPDASPVAIIDWVSQPGYQKLIDSIEPEYYRKASYNGEKEIAPLLQKVCSINASFNCKPQRFRVNGDIVKIMTTSGPIVNPENHESLPYIKITGTGDITLQINDQTVLLQGIGDYIEIDSELQSAYRGTQLMNNHLFSPFPVLNIGTNQISWTGNVSKVEIIPRWWTL